MCQFCGDSLIQNKMCSNNYLLWVLSTALLALDIYISPVAGRAVCSMRKVVMSKIDNLNGFSLIEMMIAMFLLMIGFLAVITVLWSSAQSGSFSRNMTTAANLNQDIMERLTSLSYDSLPVTADFVDYTNANPMSSGFTRQTKVEENAAADLKTITVKIGWTEQGRTKTRLFTVMKSKSY